MRVVVFRARPDGERTAAKLTTLGHDAVLAPVFDIVPTGTPLPGGDFDVVVFTSAHAPDAIADDPRLPGLLPLPCFCVGDRTAARARDLGFAGIHSAQANAEVLGRLLLQAGLPRRVLLVAGRDRKTGLDHHLQTLGCSVSIAEVYDAQAVDFWSQDTIGRLKHPSIDVALHYSRRSAALALTLARKAGIASLFALVRHHCLSEDCAAPLRQSGATHITVAPAMNEAALLGSLV